MILRIPLIVAFTSESVASGEKVLVEEVRSTSTRYVLTQGFGMCYCDVGFGRGFTITVTNPQLSRKRRLAVLNLRIDFLGMNEQVNF